MIRIIIVEDEELAFRKLRNLLKSAGSDIQVLAQLETVKDAVQWIQNHPDPDLGFFDIQLADDTSFEIFRQCEVNFPVVFVTAYDDYLLKSFEHNSIHYLLKPVTAEKIALVLNKLKKLEKHFINSGIREFLQKPQEKQGYRKRLIVKKGMDFTPLETGEIAYFFTEHKISFVRDRKAHTYIIDDPLSEIEKQLDPDTFFRVNRQYLVNSAAIKKYSSRLSGKIMLHLDPPAGDEVIIGKETAVKFRRWIKGI